MKYVLRTILLLSSSFALGFSFCQQKLEDHYIGNPYHVLLEDGKTFNTCIDSIKVNDTLLVFHPDSSHFLIDVKDWNLKMGTILNIEVFHNSICSPIILNAFEYPRREMVMRMRGINYKGTVRWEAKTELNSSFVLEHHLWNKWVPIDTIPAISSDQYEEYISGVMLHDGINKVRVRYYDSNGDLQESFYPSFSQIEFKAHKEKVTFEIDKRKRRLNFSSLTTFQVYDMDKDLIAYGTWDHIPLDSFPEPKYHLFYDTSDAIINLKWNK